MWREFVALAYLVRVFCSRRSAVGFAVVALCTGLLAQAAVAGDTTATKTTTTTNTTTTTTTTTSWGGLSWGIGVAADFDIGGKRVNDATIVNNIVRVSDTSKNVGVGFVLEAHYFLKAKEIGGRACAPLVTPIDAFNCSDVATGPFVAIEVGGGSASTPDAKGPITAYAMGWMVGLRHPSASISPTSSWNFGVGLRVEPGAKTLGDGLIANQALPVGDSIRFKTEPRYGLMLLSSFSF